MVDLSEIDNKKKALFAILIGALIAGALPALTKIGLREVPPLTFAFLRFLLALLFLIPYILKQRWQDYVIVFPLSVLARRYRKETCAGPSRRPRHRQTFAWLGRIGP